MNYPVTKSISYWWNLGSFTFMVLLLQIFSGVLLTFFYSSGEAFYSVVGSSTDINFGFLFNYLHMVGATLFFGGLFLHMVRGLLYSSGSLWKVWSTGVLLLILSMVVAFLGYTLPFSNMSYWAAGVITSLVGVVPLVGDNLLSWLWGGVSVNLYTLKMFFTLHYLLPFLLMGVVLYHIYLLHEVGASSRLSVVSYYQSLPFSMFIIKDLMNLWVGLLGLMTMLLVPMSFTDPDMYENANFMKSPEHITPEWYFLFVYSMLRAVPNKALGAVLAIGGVLSFFLLPLSFKFGNKKMLLGSGLLLNLLILSYLGVKPAGGIWLSFMQLHTVLHFLLIAILL